MAIPACINRVKARCHLYLSVSKLLAIVTVITSGLLLTACHDELHVTLKSGGAVQGKWHDGIEGSSREFLGIPYAKPPTGDLRFKPPKPIRWRGTLETTEYGPSCLQNPGALSAPGELSENCLTLNVHAPALNDRHKKTKRSGHAYKLPVMVWIHGGAFVAGGSVQYPGHKLAQDHNVIVVTMNYRLGALGFVSHPALDEELGGALSGNRALQDQQLAMQWVKANIERFGGDPDNITLMGESAGAMSVCTHIVAPGSQSLVDKFIMQSGVCVGGLPLFSKAAVEANSQQLVEDLCPPSSDTLTCLRELPGEAITAWGAEAGALNSGWGATIIPGSDTLPATPAELITSGQFNNSAVMLGTNLYEWALFQAIGAGTNVASIAELNAYIDATYPPPMAAALKAAYAPPADALANIYLTTLITDQVFRCPTRRMANLLQAAGSDVWLYSFEQDNPAHAYEIPYLFNYVSAPLGIDPTDSPTKDVIQGYWTAFAEQSTPNHDALPFWPSYDSASQQYMILQDAPIAGVGLSAAACDLWDSFGI